MSNGDAPALDASVYEGLAGFRYALRQFLAFSEAASQAAGVTPQQYQALLVIKTHPEGAIMIKDLADQMLLQRQTGPLPSGFEHGLALCVVDPFADEDRCDGGSRTRTEAARRP